MVDPSNHIGNPEGLSPMQERLCKELFDIGAIKFGDFRLKLHDKSPKAPLSPIYIDLRLLRRHLKVKSLAVEVYKEMIESIKFDLIADIPTAATPLASSLSDSLGIGMITPRTDSKSHGSGAKVDGLTPEDKEKTVVLIDDLVTHAESKIEAVNILRSAGIKVFDIVVLIDREQGGKEALEKNGYILHSAFTLKQMLNFYKRTGKITPEEYEDIIERIAQLNSYLIG